ncbi:retrovirus-related Pol polyprotein from transposon 17.6 [Trichonephila clavipes]|nr:retrovirus-related Pol polyprotein from transposon 17.6 [Trichonephila clavipes]
MLKERTIIPIQSQYASPVVLCRKNNGLPPDNPEVYRFAVNYRKLNSIKKYPRYPLPLIDDLITNIPHTTIMSSLNLKSVYFQLAINPSDIVKTVFVKKNGTYHFGVCHLGLITDHFSKWAEIIPLKKASARVIANTLFDNYVSRFGAPVKLISDNGPQFISDNFEHLRDRLRIRHVKTVVYRPQANKTERVNRDLVQMIANYVNDQHDTWDQFLHEFTYAIRTAVNETTGKTPAELFWAEN